MHWVIFSNQHGAYQYFVNHALPTLGEFRTLWRLDNTTFPNGRTVTHDGPLPKLADYLPENKVQDETWLAPDGKSYITKYDLTSWVRNQDYYGVYGDKFGSWYINPGKDYYNGDQTKQELMVHRESATGDAVQLNMIHGTHFMVSSNDVFPDGKMWGPWLWYLVCPSPSPLSFPLVPRPNIPRTTAPNPTPSPVPRPNPQPGPTPGSKTPPTNPAVPSPAN